MGTSLATWLKATKVSWFVTHYPWVWPTCETLHFIGLALLVGMVGLLDLRLLGLARALPLRAFERLVPWGVLGFAINLATGTLFFVGEPSQYVHNIAFQLKMLSVVLAGANVALFYATGLHGRVASLGAGEDAPLAAKAVAAVSLALWLGVMYLGRMLPFIGKAF